MKRTKDIQFLEARTVDLHRFRKRQHFFRHFKAKLIKWSPILLLFLFGSSLVWKIIVPALWWLFATVFIDYQKIFDFRPVINVWFGIPGAGKTSMAALLTKHSSRGFYKVLSNVPIRGAYKLDNEDLGNYDMSFNDEGAHVIIDEAVDGFDSRNYKDFAKSNKPKYFATHRHQTNRVDVFSQAYDIDKRIRDRAGSSNLFYLRRGPKGYVIIRFISKVFFIEKEERQFVDGFKYRGLPRIVRSKAVWKSFDTLDKSLIPAAQKEWELWYSNEEKNELSEL